MVGAGADLYYAGSCIPGMLWQVSYVCEGHHDEINTMMKDDISMLFQTILHDYVVASELLHNSTVWVV